MSATMTSAVQEVEVKSDTYADANSEGEILREMTEVVMFEEVGIGVSVRFDFDLLHRQGHSGRHGAVTYDTPPPPVTTTLLLP